MNHRLDHLLKRSAPEKPAVSPHLKERIMIVVRADAAPRRGLLVSGWVWGSALSLVLVGGVGTVFAAQQAAPGDALYGIKLASEKAYITAQVSAQGRADATQAVLDRRQSEAERVSDNDDSDDQFVVASEQSSNDWADAEDNLFSVAVADIN